MSAECSPFGARYIIVVFENVNRPCAGEETLDPACI